MSLRKPREDQFGEKLVEHLGKSPMVPADVATRLAFARMQAVEKARSARPAAPGGTAIALNP